MGKTKTVVIIDGFDEAQSAALEKYINESIEDAKVEMQESFQGAIKEALGKLDLGAGLKKTIKEEVAKAMEALTGGGVPAPEPQPDYEMKDDDYSEMDTVILKPTKANSHHKGEFPCKGHQAEVMIQKGLATFVKIKSKYVFKPANEEVKSN